MSFSDLSAPGDIDVLGEVSLSILREAGEAERDRESDRRRAEQDRNRLFLEALAEAGTVIDP